MIFLSLFLFNILRTYYINGAPVESIHIHNLLKRELRELHNIILEDDDYDILQICHRNTISDNEKGKELRFKRSGEDVILTLKGASIMRSKTPVWVLEATDRLTEVQGAVNETITFYVSPQSSQYYEGPSLPNAIAHGTDEWGNAYFVGRLGDKNLVPISNEITAALREHEPHLLKEKLELGSVDQLGEFKLSNPHLIYTPKTSKTGKIKLVTSEQNDIPRKAEESNNRTSYDRLKRSSADMIYPEILVVFAVDQDFSSVKDSQFYKLIWYIINFWNAVDLYFRNLNNPEVRLRIAGIIIVKGVASSSVLKENLNSDLKLDAPAVMRQLPKWVISQSSIPWDLILIQTSFRVCLHWSRMLQSGILVSYIPPAIFHDNMDYSGIVAAVHEIGHLLGAKHHESTSPNDCKESQENIITPRKEYYPIYDWSQCTRRSISSHLRNLAGDCLDNDTPRDDQGEILETMYLPGAVKNEQEQCEDKGYRAVGEGSTCEKLWCCTFWYCDIIGRAFDGTPCDLGTCLNGNCLPISYQ